MRYSGAPIYVYPSLVARLAVPMCQLGMRLRTFNGKSAVDCAEPGLKLDETTPERLGTSPQGS